MTNLSFILSCSKLFPNLLPQSSPSFTDGVCKCQGNFDDYINIQNIDLVLKQETITDMAGTTLNLVLECMTEQVDCTAVNHTVDNYVYLSGTCNNETPTAMRTICHLEA